MTEPSPSSALKRAYLDRNAAALAWKADGGTVVGYLCDNVPVELILAADCFPFRLSGKADADLRIVSERIDALYQPDLTGRPAFAASILSQILSGAVDFVDYLIIPHNRHAIQAMYRELIEVADEWPGLKLPKLHYLDKAWSPLSDEDGFNRNAVEALRDALERWTERTLDDDAIASAIDDVEQTRALVRQISAARLQQPTSVSGSSALWAYAASTRLPPRQFQVAAQAMLDEAADLPARKGPCLFVGGSPFDHDRLYAIIDEVGANVVAEDHCWGARLGDAYAMPQGAPLDRLTARFHNAPACSIRFSFEATISASVERALAAKVDAAIYYVFAGDSSQSWETPDEVGQLRAHGVPVLHLAEQSYDCSPVEEIRQKIADFLASIPAQRAMQSS